MNPTAPKGFPDPWAGKRKLLMVADVQTGYHHDSLSHALATVERMGRDSGAFVTNLRTDSQLITRSPILGQGTKYGGKPVNARGLPDYDAVFLLPSGAGTLSAAQKADLLAYVRDDGKGLVLGHAAILSYYDWPEFGELAGARLAGEFMATVTARVEAPEFPGATAFGAQPFAFIEQHSLVKERRDDVQVIVSLDPASLPPEQRAKQADGTFPVVWTRQLGKGRVYHMTWGHLEATWDDPRFRAMMLGGILWAMGG